MKAAFKRIALVLALWPAAGMAEEVPASIWQDYGAKGWRVMDSARGDLNRDGIDDAVVVIEAPESVTEPANSCTPEKDYSDAPVRRLIVAFADGRGGFIRTADEPRVLLRADEGGAMGDPEQGVFIERGSIVLMFFGGSRSRWSQTLRFRYDDEDWLMTGATETEIDSVFNSIVRYDYNALTGKVQVTVEESPDAEAAAEEPICVACRVDETCPKANGCYEGTRRASAGTTWFNVGRKERVRLSDYRCWEEETGLLVHAGFQSQR
jgi:hypothetical protein